ncbi:FAD-dependent oxidoreductase [uncultured Mucilaginibacter sp.]|uniref:FAD-dependent oxidoreductase n=1 Tax=uncultured Mucilaginibacter sp. TaxID=797541 RepID=UPI0025FE541E|nr:FAD-dependent oxidoreductase [uncultured Mucilaginibacter sp.]
MKKVNWLNLLIIFFFSLNTAFAQPLKKVTANHFDIIVYGGTASGVIAAYTAKKMGKSVLLIEPGERIGGLTTGGLGYTDIGNKYAIKGLSLDFYRKVGQHYGIFEQWIFEPHVAESILLACLKKAGVPVLFDHRVLSVNKINGRIAMISLENSLRPTKKTNKTIIGKEFIDCSYEGDLMAKAGVSYTIGREDNKQYNETYNGSQLREKHQFPDGVDPYKIPGKPESGLIWGISNNALLPDGTGNKMVQTYNIRVCLSKDPANSIPITQPDDYKPERYELLLRLMEKKTIKHIEDIMTTSAMPNHKTDINNNGPFSTDLIGANWKYPEANYQERAAIFKAHENYTKGFFYFVGHDPQVPVNLRNEMLQYGYPTDEYQNSGHFTNQMYVREARRMIGEYVMTQANCQGKEIVNDGIALAAYTMDSHNAERLVVHGMVKNEGDVQIGGVGPYPISYRSLVPKKEECSNLLVPVCLSASHIAYGSIRMEPVFMMLGQSAAVAACMAIDKKCPVQLVNVQKLQSELKNNPLADGSIPEILVDNDDTTAVSIKGDWKRMPNFEGCYGPSLLENARPKAGDLVKFTPSIKKEGNYKLYVYVVKSDGVLGKINLLISNGKTATEKAIDLNHLEVKGQTEGEWIPLGQCYFAEGNSGFAEIICKDQGAPMSADAVLFIPSGIGE